MMFFYFQMDNLNLFANVLGISFIDKLISTGSLFIYLLLFGLFLFLSFFIVKKLSFKIHLFILLCYLCSLVYIYHKQESLLSSNISQEDFVIVTNNLNSNNKYFKELVKTSSSKESLAYFLEREFGYNGLLKQKYINKYQLFRDYFYFKDKISISFIKNKKIKNEYNISCKELPNLSPFYPKGSVAYSYEEIFLQKILFECGY